MQQAMAPLDGKSLTVHHLPIAQTDEVAELIDSLSAAQPYISPRFFYDHRGSKLFDRITRTQEYYPTRSEAKIFKQYLPEMLELTDCSLLLEPGSGNCAKAEPFFKAGDIEHYVPIEISADFLLVACRSLLRRFPHLNIHAVCADFTRCHVLPENIPDGQRMLFFPGSTIGNFDPDEATALLGSFRNLIGLGGYALIGVDLKKDAAVLDAAYNDAEGITASFNMNVLHHLNARLGCNFAPDDFAHLAFYNENMGRVEMHLTCRRDTRVLLGGREISFLDGQSIHTENSWKYSKEEFKALAVKAGFDAVGFWTDPDALFSVHLLQAST